jgi:hypothetical protein
MGSTESLDDTRRVRPSFPQQPGVQFWQDVLDLGGVTRCRHRHCLLAQVPEQQTQTLTTSL